MVAFLRRSLLGLLAIAFGCVFALGLGMIIPRPFPFVDTVAMEQGDPGESRRILILSNAIHTDIALPADEDVLEAFGFVSEGGLELDHPGVVWIVFGWGGQSFYLETPTWSELKPGPVFDAFTWDASVMHVRRTGTIPLSLPEVQSLELSNAAFDALVRDIRSSFSEVSGAIPAPIPNAAYDAHDMFFPAKGGFNALIGCNTWTAGRLRAAGLTTGLWTPLPASLTWSLALHNRL